MVRATQFSADALVNAINRGDFYASTGVILRNITYDAKQQVINVEVQPESGVSYTIEFIVALEGVDPTGQPVEAVTGKSSKRPGRKFSPASKASPPPTSSQARNSTSGRWSAQPSQSPTHPPVAYNCRKLGASPSVGRSNQ